MKLSEIIESWKEDCRIDDLNVDTEASRISNLHAKYLSMLSTERSTLRGLRIQKNHLFRNLRNYYLGLATQEELEKLGREQFLQRILKNELDTYIESDTQMIDLDTKISIYEEKVDVLNSIMSSINGRNYQLKSLIDWKRLMLGN